MGGRGDQNRVSVLVLLFTTSGAAGKSLRSLNFSSFISKMGPAMTLTGLLQNLNEVLCVECLAQGLW